MSKPMVVTLPFVLLLLDYWPLANAVRNAECGKQTKSKNPSGCAPGVWKNSLPGFERPSAVF